MPTRKHHRPYVGVVFDLLELFRAEPVGFEQDLIWHTNLANVMQAGSDPQGVHLSLWQTERFGQQCGQVANPFRVLTGVVIPVLGGQGQSRDRFDLGGLEFSGAFVDFLFKRPIEPLRFQRAFSVRRRLVLGAFEIKAGL